MAAGVLIRPLAPGSQRLPVRGERFDFEHAL